MEARTLQNRAQRAPRGGQDAQKTEKEDRPNKKEGGVPQRPPFWRKMWPTWLQIGIQNRSKIDKESIPNSIKNLMHLVIDFWKDLEGFWKGR